MKIVAVEAIPFAIPYVKPLRFASGEVHTAEHVLVRVHTDDGVVGVAEAPPRPFTYGETQDGIVAVIRQIFAPQIVGLTLIEREVVHRAAGPHRRQPDRQGRSRHGDLGRAGPHAWTCRSARLLGGYTDRMRVSHMLGFDDPPTRWSPRPNGCRTTYGITTFKVKVGRRPVTLDTAVVRALRERFGDTVDLYVDGNRGWTAAESLRAHARRWPTSTCSSPRSCAPPTTCWAGAGSSGTLDIPFIADESVPTPADVTREVLAGSATAISIKTARTGFTGSQRVHHLAEGLGLEVVMGNQIDGQLGTACAVTFGAAFELTSRRAGELSNFLDMSDDLLAEPAAHPRRAGCTCRPAPASASRSTPTSSPVTARTTEISPGSPRVLSTHNSEKEIVMTTMESPTDVATAAASGASATERFHADKSPFDAVKDTPTERVDLLAREVLVGGARHHPRHHVSYDEYNALKAWLINVGAGR